MRLNILLGAAFVSASLAGSQGALAQASKFDGNWSVLVVTEQGPCDQAYRYPVIIQGGDLRYGGPESFNVSGKVQSNGAISGRIARGSAGANVTGRLSGGLGSGAWTASSGSGTCTGRWEAEKRG